MSGGNAFPFGTQKYRLNINASDTVIVSLGGTTTRSESRMTGNRPTVNVSPQFTSGKITVDIKVSEDSTAKAGDYMAFPATLEINAGTSGSFLEFAPIDDMDDEPTETVIVEISEPSGMNKFPAGVELSENMRSHTFFILDDDVPANTIGISAGLSDATADEDNTVRFTLEAASGLPVGGAQVNVAIDVDGVSNPSGYTLSDPNVGGSNTGSLSGNVATIDEGKTSYTLLVSIPEDTNTIDETITITITKGANFPSGWTLGSPNARTTWTIMVDDND